MEEVIKIYRAGGIQNASGEERERYFKNGSFNSQKAQCKWMRKVQQDSFQV